jgi:hypothetical protein
VTTESSPGSARSYGCSFGDGNPYDYIMVDAQSGDTLFVCIPCFVRQAMEMVAAFISSDDPATQAVVEEMERRQGEPVPGPTGRKRGRNAPVGKAGEDLFDEYGEGAVFAALPEEFR